MPDIPLQKQDEINRERLSQRDFDKNFLVSAGAGAGKTFLTVERAFNILCDPRAAVSPRGIVLITFTRKAAAELRDRMDKRIRAALAAAEDPEKRQLLQGLLDALPEMQISTIHSFCQRVLSAYPLESGVGFAPQYDAEEGGPDSRSDRFFHEAWQSGRCPECLNAGIPEKIALGAFRQMSARMNVRPQFVDMSSPEGQALRERTLAECRRLVRAFGESLGNADPSLFHYTIENAVRAKDGAADADILAAARRITAKGPKVRNWMGKTARKSAASAREELLPLLAAEEDEAEAVPAFEALFEKAKSAGAARREYILSHLDMLPEAYRAAAGAAELLPEDEDLARLAGDIDLVLHGIVSGEVRRVCEAYAAYCRKNHIVSLNDMLLLTAKLVREYPRVREELHERYRTFFVDEYQDTDPVQTDILFAVTAEQYDPDWHKCVPRPGSLFLVGDAKQGIYRFRGADISLWQEAEAVMRASGGEIVPLFRNFRSTDEICGAVTRVFGPGGTLPMQRSPYQAEYAGMVAERGRGPEAVFRHRVVCESEEQGHQLAAEQIAQMIQDRVRSGQNRYEDFLLLSFFRERHQAYADALRRREIPVKFDGALPIDAYPPIQLLNLRVQAVCHPFDESLSFRVLCGCGGVTPEEWDLFRMNAARLPEEANPGRFLSIRALMRQTEALRAALPDTDMNRRVLNALALLNRDARLSRSLAPCSFLEELTERSEGLFVRPCGAEEFQNQYAALRQTINTIRGMNPQQFTDMADQLQAAAESEMDRMPSIRADSNFVRLMNLHKAKGLEGRVVIFLPGKVSDPKADVHIRRDGDDTLGWFEITDKESFGPKYDPPGWEERNAEETEFLKAERIRLKYVALTRARDEAHVFSLSVESEGKKPRAVTAWEDFEKIAAEAPEIAVPDAEDAPAAGAPDSEAARQAAEQTAEQTAEKTARLSEKHYRRITPSDADREEPTAAGPDAEARPDAALPPQAGTPRGMLWGSAVHRAAELIVSDGRFTEEAVREAAEQAVKEQFRSELLSAGERRELALPAKAVTLDAMQASLIRSVCTSLRFMTDPESAFRRLIRGAALYPEIPFTVSAVKGRDALFDRLRDIAGLRDEERIEVTGKIDLALRDPDGSWRILDYKTDHMLPADHGSAEAFRERLNRQYGGQLEIYKAVLEHLTGKPVKSAELLPV